MAISNPLKKVAQFLGFSTKEDKRLNYANELSIEERRAIFRINEAYYNNNVYDRLNEGGALDLINDFLGEAKDNNIIGIHNPVKRVVDTHANNVFAGTFGQDIQIDDTTREGRPIHKRLRDYVNQIAKWSNFDQELERYVHYGALQGTVGIRVISKVGQGFPKDEAAKRRVYLEFEHPSTIINALRDKRGNVKQVVTEYLVNRGDLSLSNRGEELKQAVVRELMTQTKIERVTENHIGAMILVPFNFGGKEHKSLTNQLGVTPYVIVQHEQKSGLFGSWAFQGVERKIDKTNALSAHVDKQIIRHIKAVWAIASSGSAPKEFKMSGTNVIWFELDEGVSQPMIQAMVADLSLADSINKITQNLEEIADSLPELKATDGKYLSNQSGETIAQLRLPAEVRIKRSRARYEDGLIRAIQIALSWGILLGIFDFDTGTGTREAADKAYESGLLDFRFKQRPYLPTTENEQLDLAIKRAEAGLVEETLEDIQESDEAIQTKETIATEEDISTAGIEEA